MIDNSELLNNIQSFLSLSTLGANLFSRAKTAQLDCIIYVKRRSRFTWYLAIRNKIITLLKREKLMIINKCSVLNLIHCKLLIYLSCILLKAVEY